jgi:hypothetical protein
MVADLRVRVVASQCGLRDRRTHVVQPMLQAVQSYSLVRKDQNRGVRLSTDGNRMWVEVDQEVWEVIAWTDTEPGVNT